MTNLFDLTGHYYGQFDLNQDDPQQTAEITFAYCKWDQRTDNKQQITNNNVCTEGNGTDHELINSILCNLLWPFLFFDSCDPFHGQKMVCDF